MESEPVAKGSSARRSSTATMASRPACSSSNSTRIDVSTEPPKTASRRSSVRAAAWSWGTASVRRLSGTICSETAAIPTVSAVPSAVTRRLRPTTARAASSKGRARPAPWSAALPDGVRRRKALPSRGTTVITARKVRPTAPANTSPKRRMTSMSLTARDAKPIAVVREVSMQARPRLRIAWAPARWG